MNNNVKEDIMNNYQKQLHTKYNSLSLKEKLLINEQQIFQHYFDREYALEKRNPNFEKFFNTNLNKVNTLHLTSKPHHLDLSQKYDVVRTELQVANSKWEQFEKHKDEKTDELLATNQEIILNIKDIKMEVYEINRKIENQAEAHKNGKINAEIFHRFFDEKFKKLSNLKDKLKEQNENLKKQITKARKKIEKKDKSNDLEFIDFHQLQIENKKYVKEVDEKNKLLLKLKMTIGKITQDKNRTKEKLNKEIKDLSSVNKNIGDKKTQIRKIETMINKQTIEEQKNEMKTKKLNQKQMKESVILTVIKLQNNCFQIEDHVKQKTIEEELVKILDILEKKLQIEQIRSENDKEFIYDNLDA